MNALGHATVGLTTIAGEYLLNLDDAALVAVFACTASQRATVPLVGVSIAETQAAFDNLFPTVPLQGGSSGEFGAEMLRLVRYAWDAALLIDIADEPSYPLIVVSEAEEPVPTNTISFRPF